MRRHNTRMAIHHKITLAFCELPVLRQELLPERHRFSQHGEYVHRDVHATSIMQAAKCVVCLPVWTVHSITPDLLLPTGTMYHSIRYMSIFCIFKTTTSSRVDNIFFIKAEYTKYTSPSRTQQCTSIIVPASGPVRGDRRFCCCSLASYQYNGH